VAGVFSLSCFKRGASFAQGGSKAKRAQLTSERRSRFAAPPKSAAQISKSIMPPRRPPSSSNPPYQTRARTPMPPTLTRFRRGRALGTLCELSSIFFLDCTGSNLIPGPFYYAAALPAIDEQSTLPSAGENPDAPDLNPLPEGQSARNLV